MNFSPPRGWLRPNGPEHGEAAAQLGHVGVPDAKRWRGKLTSGGEVQGFVPAAVAPEKPLPGSSRKVDCVVGDFTARAMQLSRLRFADASRRGLLMPQQHQAAHMLDDDDAAAVHLFVLQRGEAVATLRLLGLDQSTAPRWPRHLAGRHADALAQLGPSAELSGLAAQDAHPAWTTLRALVRAAVYVALAAGRRYLVVAARPHELRFWARFGFVRTGLGSYVPSVRPHVVELLVLDATRRLAAHDTAPHTWHHLFGGTHAAIEATGGATGVVRAAGFRPPLCRLTSRALQLLPPTTGDAFT